MINLGQVRGLGYDGKLLVKGEFAPRLNSEVLDGSNHVVGRIARVFGPEKSPYISIRLQKNMKPSLDIIGKTVYIREKYK